METFFVAVLILDVVFDTKGYIDIVCWFWVNEWWMSWWVVDILAVRGGNVRVSISVRIISCER